MKYKYTIVIPVYNAADHIENAINSILEYNREKSIEVLLIDDCSEDNSEQVCNLLIQKNKDILSISLYATEINLGPGAARNIGINNARGEFILFLDADDYYCNDIFSCLEPYIEKKEIELIAYDFKYDDGARGGRKDFKNLKAKKKELLSNYLSLFMDGSVIYTAFRREFLVKNHIMFRDGYHEDVDFLFKAYYYASNIEIIHGDYYYAKRNINTSIIHTISQKHIDGFLSAYHAMFDLIKANEQLITAWKLGICNLIAIKIKDIHSLCNDSDENKNILYGYLYNKVIELKLDPDELNLEYDTQFIKLFRVFIDIMRGNSNNKMQLIQNKVTELRSKTWGCYDLHHSVFLGADEIRICCKRFFVEGEKRGDVVLYKVNGYEEEKELLNNIFKAKEEILIKLNKGIASECTGCPYLEFKDWGRLNKKIEKISFEYHSKCNLRCIYCSDKYYGGKSPCYDVKRLIDYCIDNNITDNCNNYIWGGGEPVIDPAYDSIIKKVADSYKNSNQLVITNAVRYSETTSKLLNDNKISIMTSVDAGTPETYKKVRGNDCYVQVMSNIMKYAEYGASNIIIKYIIVKENYDFEELYSFVNDIKKYNLSSCCFQISCDFNNMQSEYEIIEAGIILYTLLVQEDIDIVYFDELFRERLAILVPEEINKISCYLVKKGLKDIIADPDMNASVLLCGSDNQINTLLKNTNYFKKVAVEGIIDTREERIGNTLFEYEIQHAKNYLDCDVSIIIAAVQGTKKIFKELMEIGFDKKRIIREIIL